MKKISAVLFIFLLILFSRPQISFAIDDDLLEVYSLRSDLQAAFSVADNYKAIADSAAGFLIDLQDWAKQYGWREYSELSNYAPRIIPPVNIGEAMPPEVSAASYIIVDKNSGIILAAKNASEKRSLASITKLMTVKTALDLGLDVGGKGSILDGDDVGGARLWVDDGAEFTILDLLKATLVASANNAANAIARLTGYDRSYFIDQMNHNVKDWNLSATNFVDPTGIEIGNISTAREVAFFADKIFANENIKYLAGRAAINITSLNSDYQKTIYNTDWLLYDSAYDDVYVTASKTGYLPEAGWNLVVQMYPMGGDEGRQLLIVVLGATSRRDSCDDAHKLANWVWDNFIWPTS